ncbi:MAG: carbohydrate porin [Terrimicrobiaceae bacterium]
MKLWFFLMATVVGGAGICPAGERSDALHGWWNGRGASGEWFGARESIEEHGLTLSGKWLGTVYGVVGGGREHRATFDEELKFEARLDFAKATGWAMLEGLSAAGAVRFRDGTDVDKYVGASPGFNPSSYQSGKQWRLMPFYLSYTMPELFGIRNLATVSGGWLNPYEIFARQEDIKLFRNLIFASKGISSNGVGWSSSYASWGGALKVAPRDWMYAQGGIYMAIPGDCSNNNHGLELAGARPWNSNGWFALGETGVMPKMAGLPGKYAVGGYYWGLENTSFFGATYDGKYGLYAMAEQTLYREPAPEPASPGGMPADGKSQVVASPLKPSNQGLRWLGFVNYAPKYDNCLPFFFYSGLVYEGLIPTRDRDQAGVALAFGDYSDDQIFADREAGRQVVDTYEGVLEFEYRCQVNKWSYVQPFVQYVIRPGGDGQVANATVLGVHFGVSF